MSTFQLTARREIERPNGFHIKTGDSFTMIIPYDGISIWNFFDRDVCKDAFFRYIKNEGWPIPISDQYIFSHYCWDIKLLN